MALHTRRTRRRFVQTGVVLFASGFVGCTGDATELGGQGPEDTPITAECEREHQRASDLAIFNRDSEPHVVEITVRGVRGDGTSDPYYEETFELGPDEGVRRPVAFDPDAEDVERYDGFVATVSTESGQTETVDVYYTVVKYPLNHCLHVTVDADGELQAREMHADYDGGTPPC